MTVEGVDFREAISIVDDVVADIGRIPGFRASLVDSPLDVTTRSAIQAKLGERAPAASHARFTIRVSRPTEPRG